MVSRLPEKKIIIIKIKEQVHPMFGYNAAYYSQLLSIKLYPSIHRYNSSSPSFPHDIIINHQAYISRNTISTYTQVASLASAS